jgi:hypothetical protein
VSEYYLNKSTKLKLVLQGDGTYAIGVSVYSPPGGGVDTFIYLNEKTKLKLVDLGDGTFAVATSGSGGGGGSPTGSAGGDLGGTYPNPSVKHVTAEDKVITYNGDGTINVITDSLGTKTFTYNGNGTIASIIGTGIYQTKTFVYDGSNRISEINV